MFFYRFGAVVRELRGRLHMTQEELAAGICSVSTIAKIESGTQMPSGRVAEALLRRLKGAGCFFTGFSRASELEELCCWEKTLIRAKQSREGESLFEQQFYAYVRLLDRMMQPTDHALILLELMEILSMSMPLEELYAETAKRKTYTYLELYMLNNIALQFYRLGSYEHAMRILQHLHRYLQEWHHYGDVGRFLYPVICNNLSAVMLFLDQPSQAHIVCNLGISKALGGGSLLALPELYGNLSDILYALHETSKAQQAYARMSALHEMLSEMLSGQDTWQDVTQQMLLQSGGLLRAYE